MNATTTKKATQHCAKTSPVSGDPAVTLQWSEWHGMREDLKEARRLLMMAVDAARKGQPIDAGQIDAFLA